MQSLETKNACRWLDSNGLCYSSSAAQTWCTANPTSGLCKDGGADWAAAPFGVADAPGSGTRWKPAEKVRGERPCTALASQADGLKARTARR